MPLSIPAAASGMPEKAHAMIIKNPIMIEGTRARGIAQLISLSSEIFLERIRKKPNKA
jgi:hypothetical protein